MGGREEVEPHPLEPMRTSPTMKKAISQQMYCARSSQSVHPNHVVATHLFNYSVKALDIVDLLCKKKLMLGLQSWNGVLSLRTRNKGARGEEGKGGRLKTKEQENQ